MTAPSPARSATGQFTRAEGRGVDAPHGTRTRYDAGRCRCDACRAAKTRADREQRRTQRARLDTSQFKHGAAAYKNWGCRCEVCTDAKAEQRGSSFRMKDRGSNAPHGTYGRYHKGRCRCDACRAANARRGRELRRDRKARRAAAQFKHGASAYCNWGCRCETCTAAFAERQRPAYQRYSGSPESKSRATQRASTTCKQAETLGPPGGTDTCGPARSSRSPAATT